MFSLLFTVTLIITSRQIGKQCIVMTVCLSASISLEKHVRFLPNFQNDVCLKYLHRRQYRAESAFYDCLVVFVNKNIYKFHSGNRK